MEVVHLMPLVFDVRELVELQEGDLLIAKHGQHEVTADVDSCPDGTGSLLGPDRSASAVISGNVSGDSNEPSGCGFTPNPGSFQNSG